MEKKKLNLRYYSIILIACLTLISMFNIHKCQRLDLYSAIRAIKSQDPVSVLNKTIDQAPRTYIALFAASWCHYCVKNVDIIDDIVSTFKIPVYIFAFSDDPSNLSNYTRNDIYKVLDGDLIAQKLDIEAIPITIIVKDKDHMRIEGYISQDKRKNIIEFLTN